MPFLSIIIPTCNRPDLLSQCLNALRPGMQSLSASHYEIIVTDDSSNDETQKFVKENYAWVNYYKGPQRGPAANRNNGAKYAKGEWLVFFDDDCIPDSNITEEYIKAINYYPLIHVFEGRIYVDRPKKRMDEESPINETGGYLWSCNFAINKTLFQELNGFDEDYRYAAMEDVDLHYRIKKKKEIVHFLPTASVCHPWRIVKGWDSYKKKQHALLIYLDKNPQEKNRINKKYLIHSLIKYLLITLPKEAVKFRFVGFKYSVFYTFYILKMLFK